MVIPDRADLPAVIKGLCALGYHHEGDLGVPGREAFTTPAGAYGDLRRTLAARLGTDRAGYTEAKSAYIERVLAASPQRP